MRTLAIGPWCVWLHHEPSASRRRCRSTPNVTDAERGASRRTRTGDLLLTKQPLLPAELERRNRDRRANAASSREETVRRSRPDPVDPQANSLGRGSRAPVLEGTRTGELVPGEVDASSSYAAMHGADAPRSCEPCEQMGGVEPADSGVAHQRVTATLHLLGDLARRPSLGSLQLGPRGDLFCGSPWAPSGTSGDPRVGWVGIEPTSCGLRNHCKASICYQPDETHGPTLWNRTRTSRSSAERADHLRKSGMWTPRAPRLHVDPPRGRSTCSSGSRGVLSWVPCQAPSSSSLFSCQRAQGAPRAFTLPRFPRAHLSRQEIWSHKLQISSRKIRSRLTSDVVRPETSKGRLVFPGGPSAQS